jgi:hypothetical protein
MCLYTWRLLTYETGDNLTGDLRFILGCPCVLIGLLGRCYHLCGQTEDAFAILEEGPDGL